MLGFSEDACEDALQWFRDGFRADHKRYVAAELLSFPSGSPVGSRVGIELTICSSMVQSNLARLSYWRLGKNEATHSSCVAGPPGPDAAGLPLEERALPLDWLSRRASAQEHGSVTWNHGILNPRIWSLSARGGGGHRGPGEGGKDEVGGLVTDLQTTGEGRSILVGYCLVCYVRAERHT